MNKVVGVPSGVAEYTPADFAQFNAIRQVISSVYESFGYQKLETSPMQYLEVLASQGGISKEIYSLGRAKAEEGVEEATRGLRFDLTKAMARYVAENQGNLTFPFKRTEIGLVYRGERPQKGRLRQFYQADFDVVGRESLALDYDAEMIEVAATVFEKLNLGKTVVRFNNRKLLQALLETKGVTAEKFVDALNVIDKIEKVSREETVGQLSEVGGIPTATASEIFDTVSQRIALKESSAYLQSMKGQSQRLDQAIEEVQMVISLVAGEYPNVEIVLDLSIARGLEYYTGTVFETNLIGLERYGSVCSGGRYEDLVGDFINQKFPGVGGSVGLSRLFAVLQEEGIVFSSESTQPKKIYLAIADNAKAAATRSYAQTLRQQGITVLVASTGLKLKKQFELAGKLGVDEVLILEDGGEITVKDMATGVQSKRLISK